MYHYENICLILGIHVLQTLLDIRDLILSPRIQNLHVIKLILHIKKISVFSDIFLIHRIKKWYLISRNQFLFIKKH